MNIQLFTLFNLYPGVNTPDHSIMFGNLVAMLQERVTPLVAILKAKDCQNVKGILGRTLSQLLDNPDIVRFFITHHTSVARSYVYPLSFHVSVCPS